MKRVLIVGMDGASPELIRRWRAALPNLDRLMSRGASGVLRSTVPPRSVPAWYSFVTGVNPAKLGVFGFSQRRPGTYDYTFANFSHCQVRPFWDWFDHASPPSAVLHVPGTFPPRQLNGIMVSGWPMPLNRGGLIFTYPPSLSREIDHSLGHRFEAVSPHDIEMDNDEFMLQERLRILDMHGQVASEMLAQNDWRMALVVFSPLDRASHQLWRHMDASHPRHDPDVEAKLKNGLQTVYEETDRQLGRLLRFVDDDDVVVVVSDHGFGPCYRTFYLNEWLRKNGYLVLHEPDPQLQPGAGAKLVARLAEPLYRLNASSPLFRFLSGPLKRRLLSNFVRDRYVRVQKGGRVRINHLPVDWTKTRAYCPDESSLYLNLKGRDPQGIVSQGSEAQQLLREIETALQDISDPLSGRKVIVQSWRKEDIYEGPFLHEAPELTVAMDDYHTNVMAEIGDRELVDDRPLWSGNHTPSGILAVAGAQITFAEDIDANIVDIAPTILHLLNEPIPRQLDGRILHELFSAGSEAGKRPVQQVDLPIYEELFSEFNAEDQAEIERQLKGLGYLE